MITKKYRKGTIKNEIRYRCLTKRYFDSLLDGTCHKPQGYAFLNYTYYWYIKDLEDKGWKREPVIVTQNLEPYLIPNNIEIIES